MRWVFAAAGLAAIAVLGACGATVTPKPSPATAAPTERVQVFYARADESPLAVPLDIKAGMTIDQRVHARFEALASAPWLGPGLSFNVLRDAARLGAVSIQGDVAALDFNVTEGEWGLSDSVALRAFLQQVVFTATDEKSVHKITLTQNGGEDAVIATVSAIITYRSPLTREMFLEGAGIGASSEERIRSRATMRARPGRAAEAQGPSRPAGVPGLTRRG